PDPNGTPTYSLMPHPGNLHHVEGQLTTPAGVIAQSYDADPNAGTFSEHYTAPAGAVTTVAIPTYGKTVTLREDGNVVSNPRSDDKYVYVDGQAGSHELTTCPT